jgi:hypothetical protein
MGGNTMNYNRRSPSPVAAVPHHVYPSDQSDTSFQRPWRHAHVLSSRGPTHPQPPQSENDDRMQPKNQLNLITKRSRVMVGPHGLVEVALRSGDSVASLDSILGGGSQATRQHERIPLLILLMDPHRKIYELEQLWIDVETDTVRDVLHAVQLSLSDRWRQDYDGLFQVRNKAFNQLIHILNVEKYGVRPLEVWVAKPWSMPAKATIQYATSILQHMTQLKVLAYISSKKYPHTSGGPHAKAAVKDQEDILTLTPEAATRIHVPGGAVLKHHHAHQFVSFAPPFESAAAARVDVLAACSLASSDDAASQISSVVSSFGESLEDNKQRAISPLSHQRMDDSRAISPLSHQRMGDSSRESSLLNEVTSQYSKASPRTVPPVTPVVPHATTKDRLSSQALRRHRREQAKAAGTPRSRMRGLFSCCRQDDREEMDLHHLQRNPTLETLPEWKPYWEEASVVSAISDSRPLLREGRGSDLAMASTRSDWC